MKAARRVWRDWEIASLPRTPWFDGTVHPVRSGVYERRYILGLVYVHRWCYFNRESKLWSVGAEHPMVVMASAHVNAALQGLDWRGLTEDLS
jgi:hypothetical protein